MQELTRRTALAGLTSAGALALAGCVSDGDGRGTDDGNGGDSNPNNESESDGSADPGGSNGEGNDGNDQDHSDEDDSDEDADPAPAVKAVSIESVGTEASGPDDDALTGYSAEEEVVTVKGYLPAPDPCHEATIESATLEEAAFDGTELELVIDVTDETVDEDCPAVPGVVEYVATVELSGTTAIDSVTVDHVTGHVHTMTRETLTEEVSDDTADAPAIVDRTIKTIDAECGTGDTAAIDRGDTVVSIEGKIPASTPCFAAVIEDATVEDGELLVTIGTKSTLDEDGVCIQCLGEVTYLAEIELTDATQLSAVTVTHEGAGTHSAASEQAIESKPQLSGVTETVVTTTDARERSDDEDWATVEREDGRIDIEGVLPASHPHHRAVISGTTLENGVLEVTVDVRSTLQDEMGTLPLGEVAYEARVGLADDATVDEVLVNHATGDVHE